MSRAVSRYIILLCVLLLNISSHSYAHTHAVRLSSGTHLTSSEHVNGDHDKHPSFAAYVYNGNEDIFYDCYEEPTEEDDDFNPSSFHSVAANVRAGYLFPGNLCSSKKLRRAQQYFLESKTSPLSSGSLYLQLCVFRI